MQSLNVIRSAGPDGAIHLTIPVGQPGEYQVQVAWSPAAPQPTQPVDALGWPIGYFEATYGSIQDDAFQRPPQDPLPPPPSLE